jgi:hypothetical protein
MKSSRPCVLRPKDRIFCKQDQKNGGFDLTNPATPFRCVRRNARRQWRTPSLILRPSQWPEESRRRSDGRTVPRRSADWIRSQAFPPPKPQQRQQPLYIRQQSENQSLCFQLQQTDNIARPQTGFTAFIGSLHSVILTGRLKRRQCSVQKTRFAREADCNYEKSRMSPLAILVSLLGVAVTAFFYWRKRLQSNRGDAVS